MESRARWKDLPWTERGMLLSGKQKERGEDRLWCRQVHGEEEAEVACALVSQHV